MSAHLTGIGIEELTVVGMRLVMSAPLLLLWLVGIGLAASRWRQHRRVSLLVILACAVGVTTSLSSAVLSVLPVAAMHRGAAPFQIGEIESVIEVFLVLCSTAAWALMLAAVFRGRSAGPPPQAGEASARSDRL